MHHDHCRGVSSGYSPLSVDSWLWNSGNCVSTGTLMVRRRRWTLHDAERLSCKKKTRNRSTETERERRTLRGKKKFKTDKKLNTLNKKAQRHRRRMNISRKKNGSCEKLEKYTCDGQRGSLSVLLLGQ